MTALEVRSGEQTARVTVADTGVVTIEDQSFTVESIGDGRYRVSDGTASWMVAVADAGDERWVFVDGQVAQVEVGTPDRGRPRSRGGDDELSSPMPATVRRVLVQPGAAVKKGDTLLMLEAMKMELAIRAPRDAVVAAINCQAGDLVPPGVNLLELK